MSPEELAERHPRLYHITAPAALAGIRRHGLLPTSGLLALFEVPPADRSVLERRRRPAGVLLAHPAHGSAVLTDNVPLSESALAKCLDGGLTPADWLTLLNARVFFWADADSVDTHLKARLNRGRERLVLVFDTLRLVSRHADRVELSAINSGATLRRPARRGPDTFVPMGRHDYPTWRRLRGQRDVVREVTVVGGVADVAEFLIDHFVATGGLPERAALRSHDREGVVE